MKIYSAPDSIQRPANLYGEKGYDWLAEDAAYEQRIKDHFVSKGWTGSNTGGIVSWGVADGSARYMFIEPPKGTGHQAFLVHIDTGDAYQYMDAHRYSKKDILERIKGQSTGLFARRF